jgi:hypothetical protein
MYCSKCGTPNADNAVQCTNCGQPFYPASQPPRPFYGQSPPHIPTRLPQAILVTLFCCQPFGIVAIVYAALASSNLSSGDYAGAMDCSRKAATWCWLAFWLGLIPMLLWFGIIIVASFAEAVH